MAAHVSQLLARLRRDPLADLPIAARLDQLLAEQRVVWRDRLLTPLVTLRLFLIQVAHGNCAIAALRQLAGVAFAPSSYCEARARLPLPLLQSLLLWTQELGEQAMATAAAAAAAAAAAGANRVRRRVLILDGSSYTTPDTPGEIERDGRNRKGRELSFVVRGYSGADRPQLAFIQDRLDQLANAEAGAFQRLPRVIRDHQLQLFVQFQRPAEEVDRVPSGKHSQLLGIAVISADVLGIAHPVGRNRMPNGQRDASSMIGWRQRALCDERLIRQRQPSSLERRRLLVCGLPPP
jgi:hypothetical protein